MLTPDPLFLTGQLSAHVREFETSGVPLHPEVHEPLRRLSNAAADEGFELGIASGFRDFERQLGIWNLKARGQKPVYAADGQSILDPRALSEADRVTAIARWSAIPGASRHHWGTDLDIYDRRALPPGRRLELSLQECSPQGIFGPFHQWLDSELRGYGFFRPYARDSEGIAPERWHISYAPLATGFLAAFDVATLRQALTSAGERLELRQAIDRRLPELFERFVLRIDTP